MLLQKLVRNEATRTDPPEIYNLRVVIISLVVSMVLEGLTQTVN